MAQLAAAVPEELEVEATMLLAQPPPESHASWSPEDSATVEPQRWRTTLFACASGLCGAALLAAATQVPPSPANTSKEQRPLSRLDDCLLRSGLRSTGEVTRMVESAKREAVIEELLARGAGSREDLREESENSLWVLCTQATYCGFAAEPPEDVADAHCRLSGRGGSGCPVEVCSGFEACVEECNRCSDCSAFQFLPERDEGYQCWLKWHLTYSGTFLETVPSIEWPQLYINNRHPSCAEQLRRGFSANDGDLPADAVVPVIAQEVRTGADGVEPAGSHATPQGIGASPLAGAAPPPPAGESALADFSDLSVGLPGAAQQPPAGGALGAAPLPRDVPPPPPLPRGGSGAPLAVDRPGAPPIDRAGGKQAKESRPPSAAEKARDHVPDAKQSSGWPDKPPDSDPELPPKGEATRAAPSDAAPTAITTATVPSAGQKGDSTASPSSPAAATEKKAACPAFEVGMNYPGNNVEVEGREFTGRIDDAEGCSLLCFEHGAEFFTYGTGTGYIGLCWCKSKLEGASENKGVTSGHACKGGAALAATPASATPTGASATTSAPAAASTAQGASASKADPGSCPACASQRRPVPALVIPTYERDLCKATLTALSISEHDPDGLLGDVYVLWVSSKPPSEYGEEIRRIKSAIGKTRHAYFHDFSGFIGDKPGWIAQQVFKLKVASLVNEDFYIVLDSKNTFVRDVPPDTFMSTCKQAVVFGDYKGTELPGTHRAWYAASATLLNVTAPPADGPRWPASITPMTLHRVTVLEMLAYIGEGADPSRLCEGPLCDVLSHGATEFSLYQLYSRARVESFDCNYMVRDTDWEHPAFFALWRGVKDGWQDVARIASGGLSPLIVGAQSGALDGVPSDSVKQVEADMRKIIGDAGLLDSLGNKDLLDCIVGTEKK